MNITTKFIIKSRQNSDNTHTVLFRIICDRKTIYITTGVRINLQHWDKKNAQPKNSHPFADTLRVQLSQYTQKLNNMLAKAAIEKQQITIEQIRLAFQNRTLQTQDFIQFVRNDLETNGKVRLKADTLKTHHRMLKHLMHYAPQLPFNQITTDFLSRYEYYLKTVKNNGVNTVHAKLKFIRTYINRAINAGLIEQYVFRSYRLRQQATKPKYLTIEEFDKLQAYYATTTNKTHRRHLQYFLFACTTGLRYSDMKELQWEDIRENNIYIRVQKTQQPLSIPLSKKATAFLPESQTSGLIFRVPSNQKANYYLKQIAAAAGIHKPISTHVARHTFATISLNMGIALSNVSKLLGHATVTTTEIYAKVINKTLEIEMQKWDKL